MIADPTSQDACGQERKGTQVHCVSCGWDKFGAPPGESGALMPGLSAKSQLEGLPAWFGAGFAFRFREGRFPSRMVCFRGFAGAHLLFRADHWPLLDTKAARSKRWLRRPGLRDDTQILNIADKLSHLRTSMRFLRLFTQPVEVACVESSPAHMCGCSLSSEILRRAEA